MNKPTIISICIAAMLILAGGILFCVIMMGLNWDYSKLSTVQYETKEYKIEESFRRITVVTDTADIQLVVADTASVTCYEQDNMLHTVSVKDGVLCIEIQKEAKWYEQIGINFGSPKITICIPRGQYVSLQVASDTGDVTIPGEFSFTELDIAVSTGDISCEATVLDAATIHTSTGDILIQNMTAGTLHLETSTGDMTASNVSCSGDAILRVKTGYTQFVNVSCVNLVSNGDTGSFLLDHVMASETIKIVRTTGDINFDHCDAASLSIETDTGDVTGTLCSGKVFLYETETGRVNLPGTLTGGACEIVTTTGDIHLKIAE